MKFIQNGDKPRKIVYIVTGLGRGGAEIMLYQLLAKINRKKFQPSVISLIDTGVIGSMIEDLGIPVYCIGIKSGSLPTPFKFWYLANLVNRIQPDLIQGWMYHGNLAAYLIKLFLPGIVPVVWSIHYSINNLKQEKLLTSTIIKISAPISRFTNGSFFVSKNSKQQHELIGYSSENGYVVPNGFDTFKFQPSEGKRRYIREELGLSAKDLAIGMLARYHPMKDFPNFIEAASKLCRIIPDAKFILAGTNVSNSNDELVNIIKRFDLEENIYLLGERGDSDKIIASLDVFTIPSAYGEAFPLVLGEAMSTGIPCVVTDVGDCAEIVGDAGKVIPPQNSDALACAWEELIEMGKDERKQLGILARKRVVDNFSLEVVTAQYEDYYYKLLSI